MELLFDDKWIDRADGVRRVLGQPRKEAAPILTADRAWETDGVQGLQSVYWDEEEGKFKLWYRARVRRDRPAGPSAEAGGETSERDEAGLQTFLCYAESQDGVTWSKPPLGLYSFDGNGDNNILQPVGNASIVFSNIQKDSHDPDPARRYKALGFEHAPETRLPVRGAQSHGVCVTYSPDGLRWPGGPKLVMSTTDLTDADCLFPGRDPHTGQWVGFMRPRLHPKRRFVGYATSADFEHWTYPRMLLTPDAGDSEWTEFYGLTAASMDGYAVGLLWVFHNDPAYSPMTNELVYSRDGRHYVRAMPRCEFLPLGEPGSFDSRMVTPFGLLVREHELLIYYNGANYDHGSDRGQAMPPGVVEPGQPRRHGIGLARLPRGRLCGYQADAEGVLETKYVTNFDGPGPRVLAQLAPGGSIQAELLDHYGEVLPGWERERCRAVHHEHGLVSFAWGETGLTGQLDDVSPEGGRVQRVIKLRLFLRRATVFGFAVGEGQG
ncbi:MAG: hypothetical protein KIT87_18735 [Anaerolineae bacterium]|nr:hypothetical protein [Anaerolineae bacterium]